MQNKTILMAGGRPDGLVLIVKSEKHRAFSPVFLIAYALA